MRKQIQLLLISFSIFSAFIPVQMSGLQSIAKIEDYRSLSVEVQLLIADIKLSELKKSSEIAGDPAKLGKLNAAQNSLWQALLKYKHYETGEEKYLAEDAKNQYMWAAPSPDFPDIGSSPMSLLDHLQIAHYEADQTNARLMIASVQYTEAQVRQIESLKQSIDLIKQALSAVEEVLGWTIHVNTQYIFFISTPSEYKYNSANANPFPIDLLKSKPDGSPESLVQVRVRQEGLDLGPDEYREMRINKEKEKFSDLAVVQSSDSTVDSFGFTTSYTFTYSWQGTPLKGIFHIRKIDYQIYEIVGIALIETFEAQKFSEIIKSFHR